MTGANAPGEVKVMPVMHCQRAGFLPTDLPFGVSLSNLPELMRVLRPLPCAICGGRHTISIQLGRTPASTLRLILRMRLRGDEHKVHTRQSGWVECDARGNLLFYRDERNREAEELAGSLIKDWWFEAEGGTRSEE